MHTKAYRTVRWLIAVSLCFFTGSWISSSAVMGKALPSLAVIVVSTTADDIQNNGNCTLREAIQAANLDQPVDACPSGSGSDVIQVPAGTYTLTIPGTFENNNQTGDIDIHSSLTIDGAGRDLTIIQVDQETVRDRIFQVVRSDILVRMQDVTLRNGNLTTEEGPSGVEEPRGGAVYNIGVLFVTNSAFINNTADATASGRGGALYNNGSLEVTGSLFTGNDAGYTAGAIHNDHILTVANTRFEDNNGYGTGGIYTSPASQTTITNSQFVANQIGLGSGAALTLTGPATVRGTIFEDNQGEGGAIFNASRLTLIDSQLINNFGGDAALVNGQTGSLTIRGTTFTGNSGIRGGGIFGSGLAGILIEDSAFLNNTSTENGGAIALREGSLEMHNVTVQGNHTRLRGGGLYIPSTAQVHATQSTLSGNSAEGEGGGIFSMGQFNFQNTTISGNQAAQGGGIYISGGEESILYDTTLTANTPGGAVIRGGRLGFVRTILAGNLPAGTADCDTQDASEVYSRGYNLVGNATGCNWTSDAGDIVGSAQAPVNPLLGPLQDNGGATLTHALLEGSPAIDAAGTENCVPIDQRGLPRPYGPACDIGAYEDQPVPPVEYKLYLPFVPVMNP